jgi:hypothetical protein
MYTNKAEHLKTTEAADKSHAAKVDSLSYTDNRPAAVLQRKLWQKVNQDTVKPPKGLEKEGQTHSDSMRDVLPVGNVVQRMEVLINGKKRDIIESELTSDAAVQTLFSSLGLVLPGDLDPHFLSSRQQQLNKIAAAVNFSDPNHTLIMSTFGKLVDDIEPDWKKWHEKENEQNLEEDPTGRLILLAEIRKKFFAAPGIRSLLYLGAGADIENPLKGTRAASMTFVDTEQYNIEVMKKNIISSYKDRDIALTEQREGDAVTGITAHDAISHEVLLQINLHEMGYAPYFSQSVQQFDTLFDKDSWFDEAEVAEPTVVHSFVSRLREGGIWVSNLTLGDMFTDLFDATGIVNCTHMMHEVIRNISFGNSTVKIYEKTNAYNAAYFGLIYDFIKEVKSIAIHLENNSPLSKEGKDEYIGKIQTALGAALAKGEGLPEFGSMKVKLEAKYEELNQRINNLPDDSSDEQEEEKTNISSSPSLLPENQ